MNISPIPYLMLLYRIITIINIQQLFRNIERKENQYEKCAVFKRQRERELGVRAKD